MKRLVAKTKPYKRTKISYEIEEATTICIPLEEYERLKEHLKKLEKDNKWYKERYEYNDKNIQMYVEENKRLNEVIEKIKYFRIKML